MGYNRYRWKPKSVAFRWGSHPAWPQAFRAAKGTMNSLWRVDSMRACSIWRCAGNAGVFLWDAEGTSMNDTVVFYNSEQVLVPKEVAEFLEEDRKRAQAQVSQDKRYLSRSELETVLSSHVLAGCPLWSSLYSGTSALKICRKSLRSWVRRNRSWFLCAMTMICPWRRLARFSGSPRLQCQSGWKSFTKSWRALSHDSAPQLFYFSGLQILSIIR